MKCTTLVTVGIVTWNSAHDLPNCLAALAHQDYPHIEVIVVDNASVDDSISITRQMAPQAKLITLSANIGFSGGHNQGIHASQGTFYMPLNPDLEMEPGYISAMVSAIESDPQYGMAAGRLYLGAKGQIPRKFDSTGLFLDKKRRQFIRGFDTEDVGQYNQIEEVFGVDGAAPLYRREMLDDIRILGEYFDEAFHSHKEDVDLSWRARIYGWRCIYTPYAIAYHCRTFQPGIMRRVIHPEVKLHAVKNRYLLLLKNESRLGWRRDGFQIFLYDLKIFIYILLFERYSLKAIALIMQDWKRILVWRNEIRNKARVLPSEQVRWFKKL
jgi:GT2 family glycosyltransferase